MCVVGYSVYELYIRGKTGDYLWLSEFYILLYFDVVFYHLKYKLKCNVLLTCNIDFDRYVDKI